MIEIDLRQLPDSGKILKGQSDSDVFGLAESDPVQSAGPLTYRLQLTRSGDSLSAQGCIEATFSFECVRCLDRYLHTVRLQDYAAVIPIENSDIIDLTEGLREDILLDLPGYPRCEDGNVNPRECPAKGVLKADASDSSPEESSDAPEKKNVWGALDDIDLQT